MASGYEMKDGGRATDTSYGKLTGLDRAWFLTKGAGIMSLSKSFTAALPDGMTVTELRVKPRREGTGFVVIVKGLYEGQKFVGFSGGDTVHDALAEAGKQMRVRGLKWREDNWKPDGA